MVHLQIQVTGHEYLFQGRLLLSAIFEVSKCDENKQRIAFGEANK